MNIKFSNIEVKYRKIAAVFFILILILFLIVIYLSIRPNLNSKNPCKNINPDNSLINPLINEGLVLYFNFNNQDTKLVCDMSENDNKGMVYNAIWNSTGGVSGDGAYEFNGPDSYIIVKNSPTLSPSSYNNHFSVSFFVKFTNTSFIGQGSGGDYVNYLKKAKPKNYEWEFREYNSSNPEGRDNRLSFYAFNQKGGKGVGSYFQDNLTENEWIFITGVIDGDSIKIYKNGILRNTQYLSKENISMEHTNSNLYIGGIGRGSNFRGSIDELRIYNKSLSEPEIQSILSLPE